MDLKKLLSTEKLNEPMNVANPPPKTLKICNTVLSRYEINPANFMKKAIIISAPPQSGKTVLIKSILLSLKRDTNNVIFLLLAPTNTLGTKVMPDCYWIDPGTNMDGVLQATVSKQKERYKAYSETRDIRRFLDEINYLPPSFTTKVAKVISQLNESGSNVHYEYAIRTSVQRLLYNWIKSKPSTHTRDYRKVYKNLFMEPQLVIIIDDLTVQVRSSSALDDLFTNYRHIGITPLVLAHGFSMFKPTTRNNASLYIARMPNDLLWLIDSSKVSNKTTKEFIESHGTKIASLSEYRLFMVLDATSSEDLQIEYLGALRMVEKKLNTQTAEMRHNLVDDAGDGVEFVKNLFDYICKL